MDGLSRIVKGYRDRIQRGGGSVVVSSSGLIDINVPSGQTGRLQHNGANRLYWDLSGVTVPAALGVTGTLTVSGTGTHSFAGPVKVTTTDAHFRADVSGSAGANLFNAYRGSDRRSVWQLAANDDFIFYAVTGTLSGTAAEALRIVNANGKVSFAVGVGIGTASPSVPLHVVGAAYVTGSVGIGQGPDSNVGRLRLVSDSANVVGLHVSQTASAATVPVLVVKGGASPGTGGDLAQYQSSGGTVYVAVLGSGGLQLKDGDKFVEVNGRGTTPGTPASGYARLWYDPTAKMFKYVDSGGVVRTITAA